MTDRYKIEIKKKDRKKQGLFLISMLFVVFLIAYQYESNKESAAQSLVLNDFDICLQAVCLIQGANDFQECLYLDLPMIASVKIVNQDSFSTVKKIEIEPLKAKCKGF